MPHLKTIGVSVGQGRQKKERREINIPSVVRGKQVSTREAIESFFGVGDEGVINRALGRKKDKNRKRVTKSFKSRKSAAKAAKKLSSSFDNVKGIFK